MWENNISDSNTEKPRGEPKSNWLANIPQWAISRWRWLVIEKPPEKERRAERMFMGLLFLAVVTALLLLFIAPFFGLPIYDFDFWANGGEVVEPGPNGPRTTTSTAPNAEVVRNLLFALAGTIGAVFGLYQLHSSAKRTRFLAMDALTRSKDAKTRQEQERNERFVRAAELLANDDDTISMAGVYALERLALEADANYAETVVEVLAGFVRERTNRKNYPPRPKDDSEEWGLPTEPIQAAVTALSNISHYQSKNFNKPIRIDLRNANLAHIDAYSLFMRRWRLRNSDLRGAKLHRTNLQFILFSDVNLQDATTQEANLRGALFFNTSIQRASLIGTNLQSAHIVGVKNWNRDQFDVAIWPIGDPPALPKNLKALQFDKAWCTDDNDPEKLHPDLLDENGEFDSVPYGFRERREKEIAAKAAADKNSDDKSDLGE